VLTIGVGWGVTLGLDFLRTGRVLRIFRVLRAFRSLRSISALRGLQMVVQTIVRSLPDMANILALLVILLFIFAVIGNHFTCCIIFHISMFT
jgi:hypothetical protein